MNDVVSFNNSSCFKEHLLLVLILSICPRFIGIILESYQVLTIRYKYLPIWCDEIIKFLIAMTEILQHQMLVLISFQIELFIYISSIHTSVWFFMHLLLPNQFIFVTSLVVWLSNYIWQLTTFGSKSSWIHIYDFMNP